MQTVYKHRLTLSLSDHIKVIEKQTCLPSLGSELVMILMSCVYVMPNI